MESHHLCTRDAREGRPAQAGTPGLPHATKVTGKPGWSGVATHTDQSSGDGRSGVPAAWRRTRVVRPGRRRQMHPPISQPPPACHCPRSAAPLRGGRGNAGAGDWPPIREALHGVSLSARPVTPSAKSSSPAISPSTFRRCPASIVRRLPISAVATAPRRSAWHASATRSPGSLCLMTCLTSPVTRPARRPARSHPACASSVVTSSTVPAWGRATSAWCAATAWSCTFPRSRRRLPPSSIPSATGSASTTCAPKSRRDGAALPPDTRAHPHPRHALAGAPLEPQRRRLSAGGLVARVLPAAKRCDAVLGAILSR